MFHDLKSYFYENVLDTYNKYLKSKNIHKVGVSTDFKAALNTASALYHLREHIPKDKQKSRKELAKICPDYDLLGDIVNVCKHKKISNNNPQITKVENIYELIIITMYFDKIGEYKHFEKSVFALLDNGIERDIFEINTNVLNMWLFELYSLGYIDKEKPFDLKDIGIPKRSLNSERLDIEVLQGLQLHQKFRFQKYNYKKGIIEPENLTGTKIQFNIYKPSFIINLITRHNKTGEEINLKIKVDENQKKYFSKLKTDEQRYMEFIKIAKMQGVLPSN